MEGVGGLWAVDGSAEGLLPAPLPVGGAAAEGGADELEAGDAAVADVVGVDEDGALADPVQQLPRVPARPR